MTLPAPSRLQWNEKSSRSGQATVGSLGLDPVLGRDGDDDTVARGPTISHSLVAVIPWKSVPEVTRNRQLVGARSTLKLQVRGQYPWR